MDWNYDERMTSSLAIGWVNCCYAVSDKRLAFQLMAIMKEKMEDLGLCLLLARYLFSIVIISVATVTSIYETAKALSEKTL